MSAALHFESYYALRVCPKASAATWWSVARGRGDAPAAISALLAGRTRVEVAGREAVQALAWAASLDGWGPAEPKPLFIHHPGVVAS